MYVLIYLAKYVFMVVYLPKYVYLCMMHACIKKLEVIANLWQLETHCLMRTESINAQKSFVLVCLCMYVMIYVCCYICICICNHKLRQMSFYKRNICTIFLSRMRQLEQCVQLLLYSSIGKWKYRWTSSHRNNSDFKCF